VSEGVKPAIRKGWLAWLAGKLACQWLDHFLHQLGLQGLVVYMADFPSFENPTRSRAFELFQRCLDLQMDGD